MKQWQPVQSYGHQEHVNLGAGKSRWINTKITGRMIEMQEGDVKLVTLLPQGMAICRAEEVDTPQPVPAEAIMTLVIEAELGGRGLTAAKVRKWLDSLKGNSGDDQAWESSNNEWE